ncbi:IS2 ORF2 (plasmid) [Shigella dysenteriae Sd197]|uniref:IS2 ORF2 n=1 Tax=Shigella dysenteriae serotype 1 (strain Sd197) TaxID=300267 RepID=Q327J3_SHIDS|nr:IS2 ORF2 [Shigella dysenteriae Sd197]
MVHATGLMKHASSPGCWDFVEPKNTAVRSPESNRIAKSFVKPREYLRQRANDNRCLEI